MGIRGRPVRNQEDFYRRLWRSGEPGSEIELNVLQKDASELKIEKFRLKAGDRYNWLKINRSF